LHRPQPQRKKKPSQPHRLQQQVFQQLLPQLQPKWTLKRTRKSLQKASLQKVTLLRKTHLKQTQSQPLLQQSKFDLDDSGLVIDDEVTFGRNRRSAEFGKVVDEDTELSDYVKFRLWLARHLALMKLQQTRG
jgi:hypothetical protein